MDVNYARWMSKDPDEPDVIEDDPRRFSLRWPSRSAVASTAMVSVVLLGGSAVVRSMSTPEVTTDQAQSVETPAPEVTDGPGAASVEEAESDGSIIDESTPDDSTSDDWTSDTDTTEDDTTEDDTTDDDSIPPGPRVVIRGEARRLDGPRPGRPMRDRPVRVHVHPGPADAPVLIVRR
jgi:hypothetical protein